VEYGAACAATATAPSVSTAPDAPVAPETPTALASDRTTGRRGRSDKN
jgi:hypothetical protein